MLFDLSKAYKHFDSDVRFAELTEDDVELNDAYAFAQKNSPTSGTVRALIQKAVAMLESGKGTRGETLWKGMPNGKKNVLEQLLWDTYNVEINLSGLPKWSMPKEEVAKKARFNEQWWKKVINLYFAEIDKRRKELAK